jgi:hypothetical protein
MRALGDDMAAAMAIHPGNLIATLLLPPVKWALPEYQEEVAAVCIHGGATSLPSLGAIKCFSGEILATEPRVDQREPLWWSHVPVTFDVADHHDRRVGVGTLPLVVFPRSATCG